MVASSPIHYQDDHSSATNTPPGNSNDPSSPQTLPRQQQSATPVQSPQLIQQQQQRQQQQATLTTTGNTHSSHHQAIDIHAYQPPWKSLADYAAQQTQTTATPGQLERVNTASPRYQQLIGQVSQSSVNVSSRRAANLIIRRHSNSVILSFGCACSQICNLSRPLTLFMRSLRTSRNSHNKFQAD